MRAYSSKLVRINGIAGMFYSSGNATDTLVIYGIGAPIIPDTGYLPDAPVIMNFNVDLLVPDYIGYGRSNGICTPLNCIKTFLNLYHWITKGCIGINYYEKTKTNLHYKRIIFIGRSFGGTYIPLLPRFNPRITELGLIYPAVDNKSCGSIKGEETNEDFLRAFELDGYYHLYRGILSQKWRDHLQGKDNLSPMDNISYLKDAKLFIGHGKKDKCIHCSKSAIYYREIIKLFPNQKDQFRLNFYPKTGHNLQTSNQAVKDCLQWLKVKEAS